jgi:lipoprotein NlpI
VSPRRASRSLLLAALLALPAAGLAHAAALDDARAGVAAQQQNRFDEAIRLYDKALTEGGLPAKDESVVYLNRATAYYRLARFAEAIADYTTVIKRQPSAEAYNDRGNAYRLAGRYVEAIADLSEAIRRNPGFAIAYDNRANAYVHEQRFAPALADYDQAIALNGTIADFHSDRGYVRYDVQRFADAAQDLQQSLALDPLQPYAVLWLHLARARLHADDREELASNAARLDPRHWPAPLVRLFLGDGVPSEVEAAAARGDPAAQRQQRCESDFYLGEWTLDRHDAALARNLLERARQTCPPAYVEYVGAVSELKRLGQ